MATVLQTAICIAARLGRPNPATYIRCARERGYLPHSGRGGRGSVATPHAETEHALLLLVAMLMPTEPKRAVELAREYLGLVKFEVRRWAAHDGAGGSEALWMGTAPNTAAEALASIVNGYRAGLGAVAPMRPVALRAGEKWGHHFLEITMKALMPAEDGGGWGVTFVYAPSGTPALTDNDVVVAGRSVMAEAGGDVFLELARILGPLPASGGSGDPIVREPDAPDDEADDLPLAAASAAGRDAPLVH